LTAFVSGAISNTSYVRVDRFNYLKGSELETSDRFNFLGYTAKIGANYNIDNVNNIFFNTGLISKAPTFDSVFPDFNNVDTNEDAPNERIIGLELGYGYRSGPVKANLNLYRTSWQDKAYSTSYTRNDSTIYVNLTGIDALHQGIELDVSVVPAKNLNISGNVSIGDWQWKNIAQAYEFDDDNIITDTLTIYADGLKVGDAAQTSFYLGADYKFDFGLGLDVSYLFRDNLYTDFDVTRRTSENPSQALKLPSFGLVDAGISYTYKLSNSSKIHLRINLDNALDELYVADANDSSNLYRASGYFGFGRTWNASAKYYF